MSFQVFFFARLFTQCCFKECFSLANGFKVDSFWAGRVALGANEVSPEYESMCLLRFPGLVQEYLHCVDERFFS